MLRNSVVEIDLKQVIDGENHFCITQPLEAFDLANTELISERPIVVDLRVVKTRGTFIVTGTVDVWARLECSRCLKTFEEKLSWTFEVVFQRAQRGEALEGQDFFDEDLEIIPYDATSIDITARVREALLLAIPTKPLCREDCLGLCPVCGENLNVEQCSCQVTVRDPRWTSLSKLAYANTRVVDDSESKL